MANRAGIARFGDGQSTLDGRIGQQGDLVISELHGRYYEQTVRKNTFFSYCQAQATSVIGTALVGNIVWNPPDGGGNLAMTKWSSHIVVTTAALTAVMLAYGYQSLVPTSLTAATATGSMYLTQPTLTVGKAKAYSLATSRAAPMERLTRASPIMANFSWLFHRRSSP